MNAAVKIELLTEQVLQAAEKDPAGHDAALAICEVVYKLNGLEWPGKVIADQVKSMYCHAVVYDILIKNRAKGYSSQN